LNQYYVTPEDGLNGPNILRNLSFVLFSDTKLSVSPVVFGLIEVCRATYREVYPESSFLTRLVSPSLNFLNHPCTILSLRVTHF
jgi:hypothetical protein